MFKTLKTYFYRWQASKNIKHDLDAILSSANPEAKLHQRLLWLVDLLQWIRFQRNRKDYAEVEKMSIPSARTRFLIGTLERNPVWKSKVAKTLRSIVREVRSLDLLVEVGLPQDHGFWTELKARLFAKILPEPTLSESMSNLFSALFPNPSDLEWLTSFDKEDFEKLVGLLTFDRDPSERGWNNLSRDLEGAILILSSQVQAIGYSPQIRKRLDGMTLVELPFHRLPLAVENVLAAKDTDRNKESFTKATVEFYKITRECITALESVYQHLDKYGVNLSVVYAIESAEAKLRRMDDLVSFILIERPEPESIMQFLTQLIFEHQNHQSIRQLFSENTKLLAKKIVDRSAETGAHYITRDRTEYWRHIKKAAGGGVITAFTVYIKLFTGYLKLPLFFDGFFNSINYAISFSTIQLAGFTLATKQPAMTGPALAQKMNRIEADGGLDKLIDEILNLIRSQVAAILGNVGMVIPTVAVIDLAFYLLFSTHLVGPSTANYVIDSLDILGPTAIFAAFTGGLLWVSSLASGWADNWFALHRMRSTISLNRRLNYILGPARCLKIAEYFEKNISGLSGNISLGLLLGLLPSMMGFFGLHLEVRHVTLASGSLAAAAMHFEAQTFMMPEFWYATLGIVVIGTLNVGVSFALAFLVAIRARDVQAPQRQLIYSALWKRLKANPKLLFYPPPKAKVGAALAEQEKSSPS